MKVILAAFLSISIPNSFLDANEFDLVNRKHLEDLFTKTKAGKNFVGENCPETPIMQSRKATFANY